MSLQQCWGLSSQGGPQECPGEQAGHLSPCLTGMCLDSVRTCICNRKLRASPLLQALLGTRFCRCTLKWSVFPSMGSWSSSLSSAGPSQWSCKAVFRRFFLLGAQRSPAPSRRAGCPAGWWGLRHIHICSAPPRNPAPRISAQCNYCFLWYPE